MCEQLIILQCNIASYNSNIISRTMQLMQRSDKSMWCTGGDEAPAFTHVYTDRSYKCVQVVVKG